MHKACWTHPLICPKGAVQIFLLDTAVQIFKRIFALPWQHVECCIPSLKIELQPGPLKGKCNASNPLHSRSKRAAAVHLSESEQTMWQEMVVGMMPLPKNLLISYIILQARSLRWAQEALSTQRLNTQLEFWQCWLSQLQLRWDHFWTLNEAKERRYKSRDECGICWIIVLWNFFGLAIFFGMTKCEVEWVGQDTRFIISCSGSKYPEQLASERQASIHGLTYAGPLNSTA